MDACTTRSYVNVHSMGALLSRGVMSKNSHFDFQMVKVNKVIGDLFLRLM